MASIFSKIVKGEIPCYKVAEDEKHLAFLDIRPLKKGHTLVIPKAETDYIFDLSPADLADLHIFAQKTAKAIQSCVPCLRIGVVVLGLEVPHAHVHLVPLTSESDVIFNQPRPNLSTEEMKEMATKIADAFAAV
jgi:histidine triad (HIT) family protein